MTATDMSIVEEEVFAGAFQGVWHLVDLSK